MTSASGTRQRTILLVAALISAALIFVLPPIGFIACAVMLVVAPPWGRTLTERGIISALTTVGLVALTVPRASTIPVTTTTAHLGLAAITIVATALRFIPRLGAAPIPRPRTPDWIVGALALVSGFWLLSAYLGAGSYGLLSGLFFTGWDHHGHFTPFANTYEAGQTLWQTVDGSVAWNQWYPSLHSTVWSLAQLASQAGADLASRTDLLWPYIQWSSVSFALCLAALAWIVGDLTTRITALVAPKNRFISRTAPVIALLAFAAFALLGSPQTLANYGFTNFMMAVTITAVTAYLTARDTRSARNVGWFLIPLGALAINGLWTPLLLGLIPSALVVLVAIWRANPRRPWLAPLWAVASAALVGGTVYLQSKAIVELSPGSSSSFLEDLGAVGTGMAPFNIGIAIVAPVIAVLAAVMLIRAQRGSLAVAVAGSSVMISLFLILAMSAADQADLSRLTSYYALKTLDALLLVNAPLLATGAGISTALVLKALKRHLYDASSAPLVNKANAVIAAIAIALVGVSLFGYIGASPKEFSTGFASAPGIAAGTKRAESVKNDLLGESVIRANEAAAAYPEKTTLMWDGGGTLPNLWLASLHGVLSSADHTFYSGLPPFPYDDKTVKYVDFALGIRPSLDLAVTWFRDVTGEQLNTLVRQHPDRVVLVTVPMRSSPLCQECSL